MPHKSPSGKPSNGSQGIPPAENDAPADTGKRVEFNDDPSSTGKISWIEHATFWSQVGLGIIGIAALVIYYCQLQTTITSIKQSADFFNQQNRPWAGLETPILISAVSGQSLENVKYKTTIKNFGQSPAFNVIPEVDLVVGARGTNIRPEIDRICQHLEQDLLPIPLGVGEVLFPGGDYSSPTEASPQRGRRIDQAMMRPDDPVYFFPGCIVYKDTGNKVHHTGICQWADTNSLKEGQALASCSRQFAD